MTLAIALVPLALLASYLAAEGLTYFWVSETTRTAEPAVTYIAAAALHAAWVLPAQTGRRPVLVAVAWLITAGLTSDGLTAAGVETGAAVNALLLEGIVLALAASSAPVQPWPDRVARWRRTRTRITTELRMAQGLIPWTRTSVGRFLFGEPDRPLSASFERIVSDLADHEDRMRRTVASLTLPDAVRDSLHTAAQTIVADAEATTARMAIELERRALDHAAACRDGVMALDDVPEAERERLARECESLILDLAHSIGTAGVRS